MAKYNYDIFISYSHRNQDWVRDVLLPRLEKAKLKVFIDYRDFEIGESGPDAMERAVIKSKQTIIVLSPAYLKSGWTKFENLMVQVMDPANLKRRLIPILLEECKIPLRLGTFTYANLANSKDTDLEWQKLFKALKVSTPYITTHKPPKTYVAEKPITSNWHLAHPYPMPPNFTGRATELKMLDEWLANDKDRLFILRALGGFGKSALTWQWINTHVNPAEWTKLVWWSFYEGDASFEHFIEETLKYLKLEVPQGQRLQVDALLKAMQGQKILLIMDGFERALRAYSSMNAAYQADESPLPEGEGGTDCVNLDADNFLKSICSFPNMKGKVLMTTRLTPRAVKPRGEFILGCREVDLTAMQKADAVEFFQKQKIKGTHAEIEAACEPYGYHPLSLRLLAGRILKDLHKPGDISVAQTIKIDGDLKQHQNHVLKVAYESLSAQQQILLGQIACFRSPVVFDTLATISKPVVEEKSRGLAGLFKKKAKSENLYTGNIESDLQDLIERGILHHNSKDKYDLHPIVRRYAYDRLTAPERTGVHVILIVYFDAVPKPEKVEKLEDLAPVIELYHHTVRVGKLDEAIVLFRDRLHNQMYFQFGAYQLYAELLRALFLDGEDKPPRLKDEAWQAWTLTALANAYALSGQPRHAVPLYEQAIKLSEEKGDKKNIAIRLGNVASLAQIHIGALNEAERNLRRRIALCSEITDEFNEAIGHGEFGRILLYLGEWSDSEQEIENAKNLLEKQNNVQYLGVTWSYRALRFLLMTREAVGSNESSIVNLKSAIECAQRALELADEQAKNYPVPRDYVDAYLFLGAAYRANNELDKAEENLSKALNQCRQINAVMDEADILLELARLRYAQGDFKDAQEKASEALVITERSGYVLQGADVNLFLAQYALEQEKDKVKAREYALEAKKLATCDGPPYYYKVAYEEAERLLEKLK